MLENPKEPDGVKLKDDGAQPTGRLAIKDWIGFAFSVLAFSISALTFYVTNLRVEENAIARIADVSLDDSEDSADSRNGYIGVRVFFFNSGNRPAVVLEPQYGFSKTGIGDTRCQGENCRVEVASKTFPLVLIPHDIRVIDLKIPVRLADAARLMSGDTNQNQEAVRRFYANLVFPALDSDGKEHSATSAQMRVDLTEKGATLDAPNMMLIPLLR